LKVTKDTVYINPRTGDREIEKNSVYPLTVAIYPVLQTQGDADPKVAAFMQLLMHRSMQNMEQDNSPFVDWKTIAKALDETK
jgi:hypothetical protein